MRWRWVLAFVPALLGTAVSIWLNVTNRSPLFYVTIDLGTSLFILGVLLSLAITIVLICQTLIERTRQESVYLANQDRRRFLRRLDHELKNPLTAILAGLANLSIVDSGAENQPTLDSVTAQVQRLRQLVAELRKLSDLETRELDREPVDMTELLEEVFTLAQEHPGAADRQLTLSIPRAPWPLPEINGDRDLLFLAVYNPLDNALKFTQPADTIELRAAEEDGTVAIEIADTGPGISQEDISQVWDELYRGEGARGVPGSGLGLALVRAIVIRHGGQATIRSRPSQGTQVTLRLPVDNR
ncbi:MAG: HAMP domain-containing sensor histidine kinase [Chloroflexota bacterium]|jgi:two-component system OmpR family sensor kinase